MKFLKTTLLTVILTATLGGQHYGSRLPQQPVHFNLRPPPDSASVLACAITIYCGFGVSKIPRQAHE